VGTYRWQLPAGDYVVKETEAPPGYEISGDAERPVTLASGGSVTVAFEDAKLSTIVVHKYDAATNAPLDGATFTLSGHGATRTGVTDHTGTVTWNHLPMGSYTVTETAPPAGYPSPDQDRLPAGSSMGALFDTSTAGGTAVLDFYDERQPVPPTPGPSRLSLTKSAWERSASGQWVPSDGTVGFGDRLEYVVTLRVSGPQVAHDVRIGDYLPGYAPGDTESTAGSSYVGGSARCATASCTPTYDAATGRLEWRLGDVAGGTTRTVRFVVRMPELPARPTYVRGSYTATLVNVAEATWQQPVRSTARVAGYLTRSVRSNAVRTSAVDGPLILGEPATRPRAGGPAAGGLPTSGLPSTGAPAHARMLTLLGGLSVLCGGWLMLRRPGRDSVTR
jgi:hypothetical protein